MGELPREVQDVVVCEPCVELRQAPGDRGGGCPSRQGPSCLPGAAHWPCREQLGDGDSSFHGPHP